MPVRVQAPNNRATARAVSGRAIVADGKKVKIQAQAQTVVTDVSFQEVITTPTSAPSTTQLKVVVNNQTIAVETKNATFKTQQGKTGPQGLPGNAATVTVGLTQTGQPNTPASVTNSGDANNAILNFVIPQGIQGERGFPGQDSTVPGPQGLPGVAGRDGVDGQAATVTIGRVSTGPAGSQATVTNVGTPNNAILDIGIPEGQQGATGQSATIAVGNTTTLPTGASATVTARGTPQNTILDFGIPQGQASTIPGPQGERGQGATVVVGSTTTLPSNSPATVINSGTATDAVFNFGIPQGPTGRTATITVGNVTTGAPSSGASVQNRGSNTDAVLDFVIPAGIQGASSNITVGTTTTLPAGASASVTNTGTALNPVLNFAIPEGQQGSTGLTGATPEIEIGTVQSVPYGQPAEVTVTGSASHPILNFVLNSGQTGATGPVGNTPHIQVGSVNTGPAYSSANVVISGTPENPVLNFTIPQGVPGIGIKGDKGDVGAPSTIPGPQGIQGPQGLPGNIQSITSPMGTIDLFGTGDEAHVQMEVALPVYGQTLTLNDNVFSLHESNTASPTWGNQRMPLSFVATRADNFEIDTVQARGQSLIDGIILDSTISPIAGLQADTVMIDGYQYARIQNVASLPIVGLVDPTNNIGYNYQFYINSVLSTLWWKQDNVWQLLGGSGGGTTCPFIFIPFIRFNVLRSGVSQNFTNDALSSYALSEDVDLFLNGERILPYSDYFLRNNTLTILKNLQAGDILAINSKTIPVKTLISQYLLNEDGEDRFLTEDGDYLLTLETDYIPPRSQGVVLLEDGNDLGLG